MDRETKEAEEHKVYSPLDYNTSAFALAHYFYIKHFFMIFRKYR